MQCKIAAGLVVCTLAIPAFADFEAGLRAYENKDYATALQEWRPLAENGDAAAQFNLGLMYYDGTGVPQDFKQAASWFQRSADQGYTKSQLNLGAMYAIGRGVKRDYVRSYFWFSLCAAGGDERCAAKRDEVAARLKPSKLAQAQRMASEWKPRKEHEDQ
jgi:TPR repeat protein